MRCDFRANIFPSRDRDLWAGERSQKETRQGCLSEGRRDEQVCNDAKEQIISLKERGIYTLPIKGILARPTINTNSNLTTSM
jgi:hypothetical protein